MPLLLALTVKTYQTPNLQTHDLVANQCVCQINAISRFDENIVNQIQWEMAGISDSQHYQF